ncbi:hypothetical protein [Labilibaculum manganireducens]|nr:hypothetical protein [Labilibaculum manganireducens]
MKNLLTRFLKSSKLFELFMIFIGITFSMQFNNWNEERKLKQLELELISDLYVDVTEDYNDIQKNIITTEKSFLRPLKYLDSCLTTIQPVNQSDLKDKLQIKMGRSSMSMNIGAYESFKHQGIALMKNSRLKIKLFEYYESGLNQLNRQRESQSEFGDNYIMPLSIKYCENFFEMPYSNYLLLRNNPSDKRVINYWVRMYEFNQYINKKLIPLQEDLKLEKEKELIANGIDPKLILQVAETSKS